MDLVGKTPDLSIIIVNWNTSALLRDCLSSIYSKPCGTTFEVYVVDNASSDGSCRMVRKEFPQVNLTESPENLGYSRANNLAIRASKGRDVLLLNSDTVVDPSVLTATVRCLHSDPYIGSLGCKLVGVDGETQYSWGFEYPLGPTVGGPDRMIGEGLMECAYVWGAYHLVRREVIEQVGMLDEDFFMFYEDVDWCWRMYDAGWKTVHDPNHSIIHICRASCDRTKPIEHHTRMIMSERLLYAKHHGGYRHSAWRRRRLLHYAWCSTWYWLRNVIRPSEKASRKFANHSACFRAVKAMTAAPASTSVRQESGCATSVGLSE